MSAWQNVQHTPLPPPGGGGGSNLGGNYGIGEITAATLQPSDDLGGLLGDGLAAVTSSAAFGGLQGLDMDMSMPGMDGVDMDLDYHRQDGGQTQQSVQQQQHQQQQEQNMLAAGGGSNGTYSSQQQQQQQQQEVNMVGAGAGPLPTGFGMSAPPNSSTLTEFTKRRNWSQRIIEELKDFLHILTPDGRILYVSPSCKAITGYDPQVLVGRFVAEFVHPDDSGIFMREFNESIASGNSLRFFYRFKKDDGTYMIFECDGHPHISPEPPGQNMSGMENPQGIPNQVPGGVCRGFFMMARPYPTKNAALLDSFLEHKIENERLMRRIEELKREELEENAEQDRLYREHATTNTNNTAATSESNNTNSRAAALPDTTSEPINPADYQGMPPPAKPSISNTALTRQNLDSALSAQKPDSIADKMSRYEASGTHLESIELLTGLRYRDGERSHGISTGDTSPALIRGDAGIAILVDRDREGAGKKDKKKLKVADEYVCADCGTLDSPEWRKGPRGPKTLCNACGLRWAKKEKKESKRLSGDGGETPTQSPLGPGPGSGMPGGMSLGGLPQPPGLPMQGSTGSSG